MVLLGERRVKPWRLEGPLALGEPGIWKPALSPKMHRGKLIPGCVEILLSGPRSAGYSPALPVRSTCAEQSQDKRV